MFFPGGFCSDAEARLSKSLGEDPMATTAPEGVSLVDRETFQPCEGNGDSDYYGGALVVWAYPADRPQDSVIETFYQALGGANGWRMYTDSPGRLAGCKIIDETSVSFDLGLSDGEHDGRPTYWVELAYEDLHNRNRCEAVLDQ